MANTPKREYFEETERYFRESEVKGGTRGERVEMERNVYRDPPRVSGHVSHFFPRSFHAKPNWGDDWAMTIPRSGAWNRTTKSLSSRVLREEHYRPPSSPSSHERPYLPSQNSYPMNGYGSQPLPRAHLYSPTPEDLASMTSAYHSPPAPIAPPKTPRQFYYRSGEKDSNLPAPPQQLPPRIRVVPIDQRWHRPQEHHAEHQQLQHPQYPIKIHVDLPVTNEPMVAVTEYQSQPHQPQAPQVEEKFGGKGGEFSPPVRAGSPQSLIGIGEIINASEGFTIRLDVSHFQPKNIRIGLSTQERILSVEGERIDEDNGQSVKRCFLRRYFIPDDIKLRTVRAMVAEDGMLIVKGARRTWKETEIDVQFEPPVVETASSVGSTSGSTMPDAVEQHSSAAIHPILAEKKLKPYKVFGMEAGDHSSSVSIAHRDEPKTVQFAEDREEKHTEEGDESFHV